MCNTITAMRIHILDTTTKEIAEHGKQIEAQTPFILPHKFSLNTKTIVTDDRYGFRVRILANINFRIVKQRQCLNMDSLQNQEDLFVRKLRERQTCSEQKIIRNISSFYLVMDVLSLRQSERNL